MDAWDNMAGFFKKKSEQKIDSVIYADKEREKI